MEFRTQGYNGYAVKYSPFFDSRICVAASANYGIVGNGRVYVLQLTPNGIRAEKQYVYTLEKADCGLLMAF
jgi:peroxin-7